ncbi:MAG: hypothetical protein KDK45_09415, partial [Leptospiraceae bacterium]|nr:hypothetical protein [Leptospiraceae bacterium]
SEYCLIPENNLYEGFSHRIGNVNLLAAKNVQLKDLEEGIVLLEGFATKDLTKAIKKKGKCDPSTFNQQFGMQQIRMDWMPVENRKDDFGLVSWIPGLTNREALRSLSYLEVLKIRKANFFSLKKEEKHIKVTFTNILEQELPSVKLNLHYEGGRGKPSPRFKTKKIPTLKPGKSYTFTVPKSIEEGLEERRKDRFFLETIELHEQVGQITFMIELSIPR